ncbi:MAG: hypothetical protein UZ22_OP11002000836 [Microgenomates bacterium OLB23]|nr:MAG: hypothetical protein UZ22_OP11002000836 [Microgenomates bacterium OLB23]
MFYVACSVIFAAGIVTNTKWFAFYAANQYDIRYFYPFLLCLAPMLAVALHRAQSLAMCRRFMFNLTFLCTFAWGLYMGWLGQLSMLLPSLTGERRIWVDFNTSLDVLSQYSTDQLWYYTFMNYPNASIGLACYLGLLACYFVLKKAVLRYL